MDRLVRIKPTGFKIEGRHEDAYFTGWFIKEVEKNLYDTSYLTKIVVDEVVIS